MTSPAPVDDAPRDSPSVAAAPARSAVPGDSGRDDATARTGRGVPGRADLVVRWTREELSRADARRRRRRPGRPTVTDAQSARGPRRWVVPGDAPCRPRSRGTVRRAPASPPRRGRAAPRARRPFRDDSTATSEASSVDDAARPRSGARPASASPLSDSTAADHGAVRARAPAPTPRDAPPRLVSRARTGAGGARSRPPAPPPRPRCRHRRGSGPPVDPDQPRR